jgi:hypothetical protein
VLPPVPIIPTVPVPILPNVPVPTLPTVPTVPAPTVPVPTLPSVPSTTAAPTNTNTTRPSSVVLSAYSLFYEIDQIRIPSVQDYEELALVTRDFLNTYFSSVFADSAEVEYSSAETSIVGSKFQLAQPVKVDYNTTVNFDSGASTFIPSQSDLDSILQSAFTGVNNATYLAIVQTALQITNIFSTTRAVGLQQDYNPPPTNGTSTASPTAPNTISPTTTGLPPAPTIAPTSTVATKAIASNEAGTVGGITAGVAAFLLLGVLAVKYRHTKKLNEGEFANDDIVSSTRDRPYIKKFDDTCPPNIIENCTLSTSDSRSEISTRSFVPYAKCDEQYLRSVWQSAILDEEEDDDTDEGTNDEDNEVDTSQTTTTTTTATTIPTRTAVQTSSSIWISPRNDEDGPFDGIELEPTVNGMELDDTTATSGLSVSSHSRPEMGYESSSSSHFERETKLNDS